MFSLSINRYIDTIAPIAIFHILDAKEAIIFPIIKSGFKNIEYNNEENMVIL